MLKLMMTMIIMMMINITITMVILKLVMMMIKIAITKIMLKPTQVSPAQLRVDNIEESDAGNFSCRVDFSNSPTVTSMVSLQVVDLF